MVLAQCKVVMIWMVVVLVGDCGGVGDGGMRGDDECSEKWW